MTVKDILKIKSTGELCVDEGSEIVFKLRNEKSEQKVVRVINADNYDLTEVTRKVSPNDLFTYLVWDGNKYVSP